MESRILDLKLKRVDQLNAKLMDALKKNRIPASRAAALIIQTAESTPDCLVPSIWNIPPESNKYRAYKETKNSGVSASCCTIV